MMKKSIINNPTVFRANVRDKLRNVIYHSHRTAASAASTAATDDYDNKVHINCEVSIYNYAIMRADAKQIIKKWDNAGFCELYIEKLRTILWNLANDKALAEQCRTHLIDTSNIAFMTHQHYNPNHWLTYIEEKKKKDDAKSKLTIEASTDKFTCSKCKSKKCTYYELQTRSADEPVTIFITCLVCDKRWKS